jgi:hypothetical protein
MSIAACSSFLLILLTPVASSAAGAISQGFQTDETTLTPGTLLSFGPKQGFVEAATTNNAVNLAGIASTESLVELSAKGKNVQVVVNGLTQALVSNANGAIEAGDKITASPFAGIGMKATDPTEIVGIAQASLSSEKTIQESVTEKNGEKEMISVGAIPLEVNVAYFSSNQNGSSIFVPPFLQSIADAVSGSEVSPLRVLASALTLILGFATVVIILYISIRASITAIGRNPLANTAVRKGLVDVLVMAAGILVVTLVTMYVIVGS